MLQIEGPVKYLRDLRESYVVPELIKFSRETLLKSTPVIRPMWMIDGTDPNNQEVSNKS